MNPLLAKIRHTVLLECKCGAREEFDQEHKAWEWLLDHVRSVHDWDVWETLERRARKAARCNNGCGYWDSDTEDGWTGAQEGFKDAWRTNVLKEMVHET